MACCPPKPSRRGTCCRLPACPVFQVRQALQNFNLLFDRGVDLILRQQFADRALNTFAAGAVVAPDVDDQRVVTQSAFFQSFDHSQHLSVGMLNKAGVNFHQSTLEGTLCFRDVVPALHGFVTFGELRSCRNDAHFQLTLEGPLAIGVPAVIKLALVLVRPFLAAT